MINFQPKEKKVSNEKPKSKRRQHYEAELEKCLRLGLTKEEIRINLGVSTQVMQRWSSGRTEPPVMVSWALFAMQEIRKKQLLKELGAKPQESDITPVRRGYGGLE